MHKTVVLLISVLILSCATMSIEQKCKESEKYMDMARVAETTDKKLSIQHTMKAVELCPTGIKYAYMANLDADMGMYNVSLQWAEAALQREPSNPNVLVSVSHAYFKMGRYNEAIPLLGKALFLQPNNCMARQTLAEIYLVQRDMKRAEVELLKNIENDPQYASSYYTIGRLYMDELNEYPKAYTYLSKYKSFGDKVPAVFIKDVDARIKKIKEKLPNL